MQNNNIFMNVSMTPELMKIVQDKVASGLYNDESDVVCDALRQLDLHAQLIYQFKLDNLRKALATGIEQVKNGEVVQFSLQDIISELNTTA